VKRERGWGWVACKLNLKVEMQVGMECKMSIEIEMCGRSVNSGDGVTRRGRCNPQFVFKFKKSWGQVD